MARDSLTEGVGGACSSGVGGSSFFWAGVLGRRGGGSAGEHSSGSGLEFLLPFRDWGTGPDAGGRGESALGLLLADTVLADDGGGGGSLRPDFSDLSFLDLPPV